MTRNREQQVNNDQAEAAFAPGVHSLAARSSQSDKLRGWALVMVGALEKGLNLLEGKTVPRAQYHREMRIGRGRILAQELRVNVAVARLIK